MPLAKTKPYVLASVVLVAALVWPSAAAQDAASARAGLANAFSSADYEAAVGFADALIKLDPKDVGALVAKGRALSMMRRLDDGYASLSKAISLAPAVVELRLLRAANRSLANAPESALADLEIAVELAPGVPYVLDAQAFALMEAERYSDSVAVIGTLIEMEYLVDAMTRLRAEVKYRAGNTEAALDDATDAIALDPSSAQSHRVRGEIYLREERASEAMGDFDRAVALEDDGELSELRATTYVNRAYARHMIGDHAGAFDDVVRGLELDPTNPYAYRNRALLNLASGDVGVACSDLDTSKEEGFYTKYSSAHIYGPDLDELIQQHCTG